MDLEQGQDANVRDKAEHHNHNYQEETDYALLCIVGTLPQCGFIGLDVSYGRMACCQLSFPNNTNDNDDLL